jgi:hypothetical protein
LRSSVRVTGRWAGAGAVLALAGAFAAGSGCDGNDKATPPSAAASTNTASPSPTIDPAIAKAIDAYNGYLAAYARASQNANPNDPTLGQYVGDPLLTSTKFAVEQLKNHGQKQVGAQKGTVVSSQANLAAKPPTVTLQTCLDYSGIKLVYQKDQSPVPHSEIPQHVGATVTVAQYPDGRWLVNNSKQSAASC